MLPVVEWNIQITDSETHARQVMDMLVGIGPRPEVIVIEEAYLPYYGIYLDELQRQLSTGKKAGRNPNTASQAASIHGSGFPIAASRASAAAVASAPVSTNGL